MKLQSNKLVKVSDISIPSKFFTRMKTNIVEMDNLFGDGIIPGLTFTITAAPGTGKTTLMLQLLNKLSLQGYKTGYFTGEEDVRQIAFTCKRLEVTEVSICNETNIDEICKMAKDLDIIVIDSFQCLTAKGKETKSEKEKYVVEKITQMAEQYECAVGVILHITKAGVYKGSTLIPHAVGANFKLDMCDGNSDERVISSSKNRYGSVINVAVSFGQNGFNFEHCRYVDNNENAPSKADNIKVQLKAIMNMDPPNITMQHIMKDLDVNRTRAYILLKELTDGGKLTKYGRGDAAVWKRTEVKVEA